MAKKEHRVKELVQTPYLSGEKLTDTVGRLQTILKTYPDAWIEYDYYGHNGEYDIHIYGTREETQKEREARLDLAKKNREAAKKAKEVQQAKELEILAKLKAKYEKE